MLCQDWSLAMGGGGPQRESLMIKRFRQWQVIDFIFIAFNTSALFKGGLDLSYTTCSMLLAVVGLVDLLMMNQLVSGAPSPGGPRPSEERRRGLTKVVNTGVFFNIITLLLCATKCAWSIFLICTLPKHGDEIEPEVSVSGQRAFLSTQVIMMIVLSVAKVPEIMLLRSYPSVLVSDLGTSLEPYSLEAVPREG